MRFSIFVVCFAITTISLLGCSGKTTDPRQGGLFSYNPEAYENRLQDRQSNLSQIEQATRSEQSRKTDLETSKKSQIRQKEKIESELSALSANIMNLNKTILSVKTKTVEQKLERDKVLKDIGQLKASYELADDLDNDEEKQFEIERLKKHMDDLEKEVEALMIL